MIVTEEQMLRWIQQALRIIKLVLPVLLAIRRAYLAARHFLALTFHFLTGAVFLTRPAITRERMTRRYVKYRIRSNVLCQPCHREHHHPHPPSRPDTPMSNVAHANAPAPSPNYWANPNLYHVGPHTPSIGERSVTPVPSHSATPMSENHEHEYGDDQVVPDQDSLHLQPIDDDNFGHRPYIEIENRVEKETADKLYHG